MKREDFLQKLRDLILVAVTEGVSWSDIYGVLAQMKHLAGASWDIEEMDRFRQRYKGVFDDCDVNRTHKGGHYDNPTRRR